MIREKQLSKEIYKEKKEKILSIGIRIFLLLFLLVGCSKEFLFDGDTFKSEMKKLGYQVVDLSDDKEKYLLAVNDYYQVVYRGGESDDVNSEIKKLKKHSKYEVSKNKNYTIYKFSNDNVYTVYVVFEKAYLYVSSVSSHKNKISSMLDDLKLK